MNRLPRHSCTSSTVPRLNVAVLQSLDRHLEALQHATIAAGRLTAASSLEALVL